MFVCSLKLFSIADQKIWKELRDQIFCSQQITIKDYAQILFNPNRYNLFMIFNSAHMSPDFKI